MIKWLKRQKVQERTVLPGDTLILKHNEEKLLEADVMEALTVDEVAIGAFDNEFQMESGIFGVFGKSDAIKSQKLPQKD